jgi:hypothetical protein
VGGGGDDGSDTRSRPAPPEGPPRDPASTLLHDPDEPYPWDLDGPPTGRPDRTHGDTAAGSDPGSVVPLDDEPSFVEIGSGGIEHLPEEPGRGRAILIGLFLGAAIGFAIIAILAEVEATWR